MTHSKQKDYGEQIFQYRHTHKITSSVFAKEYGISRATLWRIENGKTKVLPYSLVEFLVQAAERRGREEERERLVRVVKKWLETHFPDEGEVWHIQNLLGDYLGYKDDTWERINSILEGKGL